MALGAALVDRARLVEKAKSGKVVEGRTIYAEIEQAWFKARLTLPPAPETVDTATGVRPVISRPTLLYALVDTEGQAIILTNQKRVEVDSHELGRTLWEIVGDPEPLRKKRSMLGWQAQLQRVDVHEAA